MILKGRVALYLKPNFSEDTGELRMDKELKDGDSFGELALIYDARRKATIQCLEETEFGYILKDDFQRILQV